jgi:hypothetical protein
MTSKKPNQAQSRLIFDVKRQRGALNPLGCVPSVRTVKKKRKKKP